MCIRDRYMDGIKEINENDFQLNIPIIDNYGIVERVFISEPAIVGI